jgi:hypothetical protein
VIRLNGVVCGVSVAFSHLILVCLLMCNSGYVDNGIGAEGMKHLSAGLVHVKQLTSLVLDSM